MKTAEYYVEGLCPRRSNSSGFVMVSWGSSESSGPQRASHVWRRLHKAPLPHHDATGEWVRSHAAQILQANTLALRVVLVVSWHTMNVSLDLPLTDPEKVQELMPSHKPVNDGVPGDEWKFDDEDNGE